MSRRVRVLGLWITGIGLYLSAQAIPAVPLLYRLAAFESPVRGDPDDLLFLAGYGLSASDIVVYAVLSGDVDPAEHPGEVPTVSTASTGVAEVLSSAGVPYSLTVRLPKLLRPDVPYSLWVRTVRHEWSAPVRINDARPYWLSPAVQYSNAEIASLPRVLKVIGRNLEPAPGYATELRLSGPVVLALKTVPDADTPLLDSYVAVAALPAHLPPGEYRVQLRRDALGWVALSGQVLTVRADPAPLREFAVDSPVFGGCRGDRGADASSCIVRAIAAAAANGGGTVVFGPGVWHIVVVAGGQRDGILVPRNVNLRGAGRNATTLVLDSDARDGIANATFTLLGHNVVSGFTFRDSRVFGHEFTYDTFLRLGPLQVEGQPNGTEQRDSIDDIVITQNLFDRPNVAISDGGLAIKRLFISYNEFRAYRSGLELAGNRFLVNQRFGLEDSVVTHNLFKPGSYIDAAIRQGAMASEIGGSTRVDFSNNTADGASRDALYSPKDPNGWRAAFFWHMNNNQEELLVAQNAATCTGDKIGDGEAISFDNNANTFALPRAATVLAVGPHSLAVAGPLAQSQYGRDIHVGDYYAGHWIQVGSGPGLGEVRKIVSYTVDAGDGHVNFEIAPDWDVPPVAGVSRISIGREYWQVYTIANSVDQRKPLCQKSNRSDPKGGGISVWAQTADSVIAGNRQFDTDGIIFQQFYNAEEPACPACDRVTSYIDFVDIRANLIDGEYDWEDGCSSSGIFGSLAAGPTPHSMPPTVSYGLSIAHNRINHADGRGGGAISLLPTWFQGPAPHRWPLADGALVFHNSITGMSGAPARACQGDTRQPRTAISLGDEALVHRTTLYANECPQATRQIAASGGELHAICPHDAEPTCGCRP